MWAGSSSQWHETDGYLWPRRAALHQPSLFLIAALPHLSHDACYVQQEVWLSQETQRSEPVKLQRDSPIYFSMSRAWSGAFLPACSQRRTRRFFAVGFKLLKMSVFVKNVQLFLRCFFIELSSLFWCENKAYFVSFNEKNKSSKSMVHIRCSQSAFRGLSHETCLSVVVSSSLSLCFTLLNHNIYGAQMCAEISRMGLSIGSLKPLKTFQFNHYK